MIFFTIVRVNSRLHGDTTEDPVYPKIQFPSVDLCSDCRTDAEADPYHADVQWNRTRVQEFLKSFYSPSRIIQDLEPEASQSSAYVS